MSDGAAARPPGGGRGNLMAISASSDSSGSRRLTGRGTLLERLRANAASGSDSGSSASLPGRGRASLGAMARGSGSGGVPGLPPQPQGGMSSSASTSPTHGTRPPPVRPQDVIPAMERLDVASGASPSAPPPGGGGRAAATAGVYPTLPVTAKGTEGRPIDLAVNSFKFMIDKTFGIYEYEVRFDPPAPVLKLSRYSMVFDGMMLSLPHELPQNPTHLSATHPIDNTPIQLTLILRKKLERGDPMMFAFYNRLFRKVLGHLNMIEMRRNYYMRDQARQLKRYNIEIWPGFETTIARAEKGLVLQCAITHRILNMKTMHQVLKEMKASYNNRGGRNVNEMIQDEIIGQIVLTRYNHETYRIDDIDVSKNPKHCFERRGQQIRYVDYYRDQWNVEVQNLDDPLLLSQKKRKMSDGRTEIMTVYLIPELCYLTGLSKELKSDFHCKKDVDSITRTIPGERVNTLQRFVNGIYENEEAESILREWGVKIDRNVLSLPGRNLGSEKVYFGQGSSVVCNQKADFSNGLTSKGPLKPIDVHCWGIIYPSRDEQTAQNFMREYKNTAMGMKIRIANDPIVRGVSSTGSVKEYLKFLQEMKQTNPQIQFVVIIFSTSRDDYYNAVKKYTLSEEAIPTQVIIAKTLTGKKFRPATQKIALQINAKLSGELWRLDIPFKGVMHSEPCASTLALAPSTLALPPSTLTLAPSTLALPPSTLTLAPSTLALPPSTRALALSILALVPSSLALALAPGKPQGPALAPCALSKVCGVDAYHEKGQNSWTGFCASVNQEVTKYFHAVSTEDQRSDLTSNLRASFGIALQEYAKYNNAHPSFVVMYRDGVSDGELETVRNTEMKAMQSVISTLPRAPTLVFVIVQKRINTRIFALSGQRSPNLNYENPDPGTVLDHTVTRFQYKDFFLVSQHVGQNLQYIQKGPRGGLSGSFSEGPETGTVTPTHYIVLQDDEKEPLSTDVIQKITYKMCHLYYNWPGTVRVPAPCMYAHKLAKLVGFSVKRNIKPEFARKQQLMML
ncbi:unnamed protein product [Cyprideis torosa]|uniref:Uncharacterized protein n=1 Tax=Cyprideis torosa TaxID=163714 RepID=A0A7R8WD21_9CRUS|nr:unnamed protein product [Cyprideis torosa]CAG0888931.1 unnamed protein product [Cyprideis torosa]